MSDEQEPSGKPAPPRSVPPMPPPPEMLRAAPPHVSLTPMMEFLQRRLETIERELALEREKARAAQGQLTQQEALRGEVESQLKALSENIRREKSERESEESKSHARGRIDSLEKRLDDMHQSWVALLKEAVTQRDGGAQALSAEQAGMRQEQAALHQEHVALRQELTGLSGGLKSLIEQIGQWRQEAQGTAQLVPEVRHLAQQLPADERRFETQISQMLSDFSADLRDRMASWERRQALELEKQEERIQGVAREKAAMLRSFEESKAVLHEQTLKERLQMERESSDRLGELGRALDGLRLTQEASRAETEELRKKLAQALERLAQPALAKDEHIAALELEREDLVRALRSRAEALQNFVKERREIEKTMGESLALGHRELDDERRKHAALSARISELELENARLRDQLESAARQAADKDERATALLAERDALAKALMSESERLRVQADLRGKADQEWTERLEALQKKLAAETELRGHESASVSDLRAQIVGLSAQIARALEERDGAVERARTWDHERARLTAALREKDDMISMLNATFQNMLKKP